MTKIKVLLYPKDNPKARWLIQETTGVAVISECCADGIKQEHVIEHTTTSGVVMREVWARCNGCKGLLERNERGWVSDIGDLTFHTKTRPDSWGPWGEYWFGLKDFAMEVTV
jgi:hypothetical protein